MSKSARFRAGAPVVRLLTLALSAVLVASALPPSSAGRERGADVYSREVRAESTGRLGQAGGDLEERARSAFDAMPLSFEVNRGQSDAEVKFISRGGGYNLFLTQTGAVLSLSGHASSSAGVLRMRLGDSNPAPRMLGLDALPGHVNYFKGRGTGGRQTGVEHFSRVKYEAVYPGIDMVYYGKRGHLEYDFDVAPGADPRAIKIEFRGADRVEIGGQGELLLHTDAGVVRQDAPYAYQEDGGVRRAVSARFVLLGRRQVGFEVAAYDASRALVIDPVLVYSTYLGGSATNSNESGFERPSGVAVDAAGNIYVTGLTSSLNFPLSADAVQKRNNGGSRPAGFDLFVTKLSPAGNGASDLVYSTYLGGSEDESMPNMTLDGAGDIYLTGYTKASNFPMTANSFRPAFGGGADRPDGFLVKLNAAGGLAYSTYLRTNGFGVRVDSAGDIYVAGSGVLPGLPISPNAYLTAPTPAAGVLLKLRPAGNGGGDLLYASHTPYGYGSRMGLDAAGHIYFALPTGQLKRTDYLLTTADALQRTTENDICSVRNPPASNAPCGDIYVAKLDLSRPGAQSLVYATWLGGHGDDVVSDMAVDNAGSIYLTGATGATPASWLGGNTNLSDFPTTENVVQKKTGGGTDAFVAKINPTLPGGAGLVYSTFLGGRGTDKGTGIAVNGDGNAYVSGSTDSDDFVITANVLQATYGGGLGNTISKPGGDAFLVKLNVAGAALDYSTYLGGGSGESGDAVSVDDAGNAYVAGYTFSTDFPVTTNALQPALAGGGIDVFVSKVADRAAPQAAGYASGVGAFNPLDDQMSFVRQQYRDFLNREADDEGLAHWTGEVLACGGDSACVERARVNTSGAFFLSIEFQNTGYLTYLLYKTAFGRMLRYREFQTDSQVIGSGVVVGRAGWESRLEDNTRAFAGRFAGREDFRSLFDAKTNGEYVRTLFANAGVTPTEQELNDLVAGLDDGAETRASVLLKVARNEQFSRQERNRAFVLMQYFGYLRRNPDDFPDTNFGGYDFWLHKLEEFGGDFQRAQMVKAFLDSIEYRKRFGPE